MSSKPGPAILLRARRLRQTTTDAEQIIWRCLRDRRLAGAKFRRQHPIGPYIADFACVEQRLIVELDGSHHAGAQQAGYDVRRTADLERLGYRVVRFTDVEVLKNLSGVLEAIERLVREGL